MKIKFHPAYPNVPEYCSMTMGREYDVVSEVADGFRIFDDAGIARAVLRSDTLVSQSRPGPVTGRKDDSGKLDMTLFDDMPRALEAVCEVMQWAITKKQPVPYIRGSWLGVSATRYRAAIMRHMSAAAKQYHAVPVGTIRPVIEQQRDDETQLLHLAHVACSALFALELTMREMESNAE